MLGYLLGIVSAFRLREFLSPAYQHILSSDSIRYNFRVFVPTNGALPKINMAASLLAMNANMAAI